MLKILLIFPIISVCFDFEFSVYCKLNCIFFLLDVKTITVVIKCLHEVYAQYIPHFKWK